MDNGIVFFLGQQECQLLNFDPCLTVLDYLREHAGLTGTKEGCAEGDCGACTVILGTWQQGQWHYRAVNSCIALAASLHGKQLLTVEHVSAFCSNTAESQANLNDLHPVQKKLAALNGSQCGFCTPGFIMSLFADWLGGVDRELADENDLLAGNLCRCTGYGPILQTAREIRHLSLAENIHTAKMQKSQSLPSQAPVCIQQADRHYWAPTDLDDFATLRLAHPDAVIVAGLSDVGLWLTKQMRRLPKLLSLERVTELQHIQETDTEIRIGAAVTYSQVWPVLNRQSSSLGDLIRRIGAVQVRNVGTVCGNIANASPIGDMPPALMALDAKITLRQGAKQRTLSLDDFFLAYGKTDLQPGEFIERLIVPKLQPLQTFACYKISKRFDQDISALSAAFCLTETTPVTAMRIAYGGMAAVPKRAISVEKVLQGNDWTEARVRKAMAAMVEDFQPIDDHRASAEYRMRVAQNLLLRFFLETQAEDGKGAPVRIEAHNHA